MKPLEGKIAVVAGATRGAGRGIACMLGEAGAGLISSVVAVAALTSINATTLMAARTTYAFGRAAPMFAWLGRWDPRLGSPGTIGGRGAGSAVGHGGASWAVLGGSSASHEHGTTCSEGGAVPADATPATLRSVPGAAGGSRPAG